MKMKFYLLTIILISLIFSLIISFNTEQVFGHGLGIDHPPSSVLDGREIAISAEIDPSFIDEVSDHTIKVRALDVETNTNIENVNFLIGLYNNDEIIFKDFFFSPDGQVTINVYPIADSQVEISSKNEPLLGAWMSTAENPIELTGPVFISGGLYHLQIALHTIDQPTNFLDEPITYDAYITIGETVEYRQKSKEGTDVTFKVKSYYDALTNFEYNLEENLVTFEMPFDWAEQNISHVQFVHEELLFPKNFIEFLSPTYIGKVNGIELFKSSIMIDDSLEMERTIHFMLPQDHLRVLKQEQEKNSSQLPNYMKFQLISSEQIQFPMIGLTQNEEFQVDLSWEPVVIEPENETKFIFTIRDPMTLEPLKQSSYDFVLTQNSKEIHRTSGLAQIGGDFESFSFPVDSEGPASVRLENIRDTEQSVEFAVVVVPEFGPIVIFTLFTAMTGLIIGKKLFYS